VSFAEGAKSTTKFFGASPGALDGDSAMDWTYVWDAVGQAMPGLILLALPVPVLWMRAKPGKEVLACSPCFSGAVLFLIVFVLSGIGPSDLIILPTVAFAVGILLLVPSVMALPKKIFGLAHILTILGLSLMWYVGAMALSHDWL
jgi:hypothetical protein